jgi:aspartyl-tRNA(Asn)/glutamyl-tRNA(Gln) amidotransferase subunit C
MEINEQLISRLEKLARLQLSSPERARLAGDLQNIVQMLDKLQNLETDGVEPLVYMNDTANVFREDALSGQWTQEQALANAPKQDGKYFRVPKVIN